MSSASVTAPATTETTDVQSQDEASRTLLDLLTTEKMDGSDDSPIATATTTALTGSDSSSQGQLGRWGTLKQRLGLNAIICCGGGWAHHNRSYSDALLPAVHEEYDDPEADEDHNRPSIPDDHNEEARTNIVETLGVNLATALAEERQSRQLATTVIPPAEVEIEAENEIFSSVPGTPTSAKVSLMRLMAEAAVEEDEVGGGGAGSCCVCMERKKGAAFIPCGHTFCRVCSRELWLNRGSCPLCNRSILDVLDIF